MNTPGRSYSSRSAGAGHMTSSRSQSELRSGNDYHPPRSASRGPTSATRSGSYGRPTEGASPSVYAVADSSRRSCVSRFAVQQPPSCSKNANMSRKMNDPLAKTEAIRTILRFLAVRGFPGHVSATDLQSPTRATYVLIMEFLMLQLDTTLKMRMPEEDIPRFFKDISCPLTITKSSIKAPGTPTTWPTLLTAMTWLCELLHYDETVISPEVSEESRAGEMDRGEEMNVNPFAQIVQTAYRLWMDGEADETAADTEIRNFCDNEFGAIQSRLDDLKGRTAASEKLIAHYKQKLHDADQLASKNAKLQDDARKLQLLAEKCEFSVQETIASNINKKKSVAELSEQLEVLRTKNNELQSVVDSQEMNRSEVIRVEDQMKQKREVLHSLQKERGTVEESKLHYDKETQSIRVRLSEAREEIVKTQRLCRAICEAADSCISSPSAKCLSYMNELCLRMDDVSLNEYIQRDGRTTTDYESESITRKQCGRIGNLELIKSTPIEVVKVNFSGITAGGPHETPSARTKWNVDSLLGLEWKEYKNQSKSILAAEAQHSTEMLEEQNKCVEKKDAIEREIETTKKEQENISSSIRNAEMDNEQLRKKHTRKVQTIKSDIRSLQEQAETFHVDLSARIEAAKEQNEVQVATLNMMRSEGKAEVHEAKQRVVRMAQQIAEFRNDCLEQISRYSAMAQTTCRDYQAAASLAFRTCTADDRPGMSSTR